MTPAEEYINSIKGKKLHLWVWGLQTLRVPNFWQKTG